MSQKKTVSSKKAAPLANIDRIFELSSVDMEDLCDATDAAITQGGGFGWVELPARDKLERYWDGVVIMPLRDLYVARLDGTICGTAQLVKPSDKNEEQAFAAVIDTVFVTPWARGHGLAKMLIETVEANARAEGFSVVNVSVRSTQEAAISLYESMGYIQWGTHPYFAKVDDDVIEGRHYYKVIDPHKIENISS